MRASCRANLLIGFVYLVAAAGGIQAQESPAAADRPAAMDDATPVAYAVVDYMKVPEGGDKLYLEVEGLWKKIHEARRELGIITAWATFRVERVSGRASDYNFATVQLYDAWTKLENPYPQQLQQKISFSEQEQQVLSKTEEARDLIRSELWGLAGAAVPERFGKSGFDKTLTFSFLKSKDRAHAVAEMQIWRRIWKQAADDGHRWNWTLWATRFPSGSQTPYDLIAVHTFPQRAEVPELPENWMQDTIAKLFPDAEQRQQLMRTPELRDEVAVENWTIVESVGK